MLISAAASPRGQSVLVVVYGGFKIDVGCHERTRRFQVHLNRIGGVMFVVIGTATIVLVLTGAFPPAGT